MYKNGTVISTTDQFAVIEVIRSSACGDNCASCKGGCKPNGILIKVENSIEAQKGDIVRLEADTINVLKFSSILYLIPLLFLMIGIIGTSVVFNGSDTFSLVIGGLLLSISLIMISILTKDSKITFRITTILKKT